MRRYTVRFTEEADADLQRLYGFLLEKDRPAAERALKAIRQGIKVLQFSPYSCRKAGGESPRLRELMIPFGASGYVVLFEIEPRTVTVLAARHQREDDYH